jgi:endonuclease YncB( thermonuclease family)
MKHQKLAIALFAITVPTVALAFALPSINPYSNVTASGKNKVVSIRDDLTINLEMKNSRPTSVRLAGIVMPDEACDLTDCIPAEDAAKKIRELKPLLEQTLVDRTVRWEMNGRTNRLKQQATIYDGDTDIGLQLLSGGFAMWCPGVGHPTGKSKSTDYARAEAEAFTAKRGIWATSFAKPSICKPAVTANAK